MPAQLWAAGVKAPAKINLFLHVTGRRPDGYHELFSLMCCVGLYDTLGFEFDQPGICVTCDDPGVPGGPGNLAHRAALFFLDALARRRGRAPGGVRVAIAKQIPVAAGLGGGSSDAAAVLAVLNRHHGSPFDGDELMGLGLKIGADVPFLLHRRPAVATGIGERLEPVEGLGRRRIVLVFPGYPVSTAGVFRNLNLALTKEKKKLKDSPLNVQQLDINRYLHNDLEPVTLAMHPGIGAIKARLLHHGATGSLMTGSGPTVFGLFRDDAAAEAAARALAGENLGLVFLVDMPV